MILPFLSGVLTKIGGVRKFRKISDIEGVIKDADAAFGDAIEASKNKKKTPGCKYGFIGDSFPKMAIIKLEYFKFIHISIYYSYLSEGRSLSKVTVTGKIAL